VISLAFIPGEHDQAVFFQLGRIQQLIHRSPQPVVGYLKRALRVRIPIVRRVAQIGHDKGIIGQRAILQISIQLGQRHHVILAACGIVADGIEIRKRVVFQYVAQRVLQVAGFGHAFLVGFPGSAGLFDLVWQAGGFDHALVEIVFHVERLPADHGNIVEQAAGAGDGVILG